ncbi:MAG: HAMP domain-containing histidine kinase [Anaerolineae bacterium]|nr:HAMP domain-containing histidine kinase [Anaerolineae bacterium]
MTEHDALAQAQTLVDELLAAAQAGTIIPVRLPGQVEAIKEALSAVAMDSADGASPAQPELPADRVAFLREQAEFMSTAVHELRVPMTSIRGYSDMLNTPSMGELNDMQKQFLQTIRTNAKRMETLLTDVSDTSKIRGGTLKISPKMDMFKNIALRVEKEMMPLAEELGRTLVFDIPQGLPLLNIDGDLLAKALRKLVENSLRYTLDGGVVSVSGEADGSRLKIRVEDNGIGMTPEEIAQLGTVYYRADHDHVRSYKGSGLGIPIAYGIIRLLDGRVSVESVPNQGTCFTIMFTGMS